MISFVWSSKFPFLAGSGGSETYTAGQVRELMRRGIETRIITIGHGTNDGREDFPDIKFLALDNKEQLAELDDTLIYITYPLNVQTKHKAYAILHCPPPNFARGDTQYDVRAFKDVGLITASKFSAGMWRRYLKANFSRMPTVYPFADHAFGGVERAPRNYGRKKVLFAGRLIVDKGIFTLLAALHMEALEGVPFDLTVTTAGSNREEGETILRMLEAHPAINVVPAQKTAADMAQLMAEHDIVVVPSTAIYWQELFGMVSIEAQHAGCRVVASRSGGLPETNLGGAIFVKPDNPKSLAQGLSLAIQKGALTKEERNTACKLFRVEDSVDDLLRAIRFNPDARRFKSPLRRPYTLQPRAALNAARKWQKLQPELALSSDPSTDASKQPTPVL